MVELLVDDSESSAVIFKTNGVELFHTVSPTVFTHLAAKSDFKRETIKTLLKRGFDNLPPEHIGMSHSEWWHRGGAASGSIGARLASLRMRLALRSTFKTTRLAFSCDIRDARRRTYPKS